MANLKGIIDGIRKIMWQDTGLNGDAQRIEQLGWMLFLKIFSDKDKELEVLNDDYVSPIPDELHWEAWAGDDEGMTGDELQVFVDQKLFPTLRNLKVGMSDDLANKRALIVREVFEGNNNYMKSGINIRKVLNKLNEIDFNIAKDRHAFGELYETILKELQSAGKSGEFYTPRAITEFICEMINPQLGEKILDPSCGTGGYLTAAIELLKQQANSVEELESISSNVIGWEYKPLPYLLATTNLILHDMEVPNISFRDSLEQPLTNYTEKNRVNVILANPPFGGIVANNNENNFPQNYRTKESADLFLVLMIHLLKNGGRAGIVLPDGSLSGEGVKQRIREKFLQECNLHTIIRLPNSVFKPYATVATNLLFFTKGEPTKQIWYYQHTYPEGIKSYSKTKPINIHEFENIRLWWNDRKESEFAWSVDIEDIRNRDFDLDIKNPNVKSDEISQSTSSLIEDLNNDLSNIQSDIEEIEKSFTSINKFTTKTIGELCDVVKGNTGIKAAIDGDYPLVTTAEERGTHNTFQFDTEAVCLPLVSSSGHGHASLKRVHYQSGQFALGSILAAAIPKNNNELSAKYLYYYLNNFKDDLLVPLMKGMANVSLSVTKIKSVKIKVPSIEKQEELIHLMEKCQQLRLTLHKSSLDAEKMILTSLREALEPKSIEEKEEDLAIAAEPQAKYEKGKVIALKPTNVDYYRRTVLAAEIVWQLHKEPTLGHLKLQKLIYLCQKSADMQLPTNFLRQAMGPYDNRLMRSIDKQLKEKKWFEYKKEQVFKYQPLEKAGQHQNDFIKYFSAESENIQFIIDKFKTIKSDIVEIVATLYACIDNMLNENVIFSEALLIQRFYEWSEEKKKFSENEVKRVFLRMKETGIIPKGFNI